MVSVVDRLALADRVGGEVYLHLAIFLSESYGKVSQLLPRVWARISAMTPPAMVVQRRY